MRRRKPSVHYMPEDAFITGEHVMSPLCRCKPSHEIIDGVNEFRHKILIETVVVSDEILAQNWSDPDNWAKTVTR